MSDKKSIDRLFQEKFKDFEVEPNEQIWVNIDMALREKKKRRVVPFWFKLSGIAAGLILGFFGFNFLFNDTTLVEENQVVIENDLPPKSNKTIETPKEESVVNTESTNSEKRNSTKNASPINPKANDNTDLSSGENEVVVTQVKSEKSKEIKRNSGISSEEKNAVAGFESAEKQKNTGTKKGEKSVVNKDFNNAVANESQKNQKKKSSVNQNQKNSNTILDFKENNAVAFQEKKDSKNNEVLNSDKNAIFNTEDTGKIAVTDKNSNEKKNSINKDISPKTQDIKKDSTALAVVEPNALEELLKKNEEEKNTVATAKMNRWQVSSSVAPIYFSSTSNGSPIDSQFAENSKSYENNLSFGVGVNYAVNNKLSVRTGVNKFTLGYNTNDVVFFAALDQATFANVSSSAVGSTVQVISQNNTEALRPFVSDIQNTNQGRMTQKMGYFEVPVEMSYKLIDKKFGVNLIGGLSTLFLNENNVSVSSSTMSASLGKAKNLNDIHFSTNVGIGFKYRFFKSFEANFEPMFKYQINTFNKDAGNFKPYFIGLYSGVSFNF